jgi:hypothetical protein
MQQAQQWVEVKTLGLQHNTEYPSTTWDNWR